MGPAGHRRLRLPAAAGRRGQRRHLRRVRRRRGGFPDGADAGVALPRAVLRHRGGGSGDRLLEPQLARPRLPPQQPAAGPGPQARRTAGGGAREARLPAPAALPRVGTHRSRPRGGPGEAAGPGRGTQATGPAADGAAGEDPATTDGLFAPDRHPDPVPSPYRDLRPVDPDPQRTPVPQHIAVPRRTPDPSGGGPKAGATGAAGQPTARSGPLPTGASPSDSAAPPDGAPHNSYQHRS